MLYYKMTRGYVAQMYDDATGDCVKQEFIADGESQPERQDEGGNPIPEENLVELSNTEKECPFDMVQP